MIVDYCWGLVACFERGVFVQDHSTSLCLCLQAHARGVQQKIHPTGSFCVIKIVCGVLVTVGF